MKPQTLWKLALALVLALSLALVSAQEEIEADTDTTPDYDPPPIVDSFAEEGAPEFAGFEFGIPNVFATGDVLSAAEMNANFTALGNGIDTKLGITGGGSSLGSSFYLSALNMWHYNNGWHIIYLDRDNSSTSAKFQVRAGTSSTAHFSVTELGDATVGRDLFVNDDATINDILTVNNDVTIGDNLTVADNITMGNNLLCSGADCDIFLYGANPILYVNPTGTDNANTIRADIRGRTRTMTLQITGGSDIAEPFNIAASPTVSAMPGMVVSIDPNNAGELMVATEAHDFKVAGIVSGAGGVNPGLMLNQEGAGLAGPGALPVALTGKVMTLVDAKYGAIQAGDLLTTSPTHGHAMVVSDYDAARGAIIGKAMSPLDEGTGLVLVLVSLQ